MSSDSRPASSHAGLQAARALLHFGSTDTRYSVGFTEDHFQHLRVGMDGKTVYGWIKKTFDRLEDDTRWNQQQHQWGQRPGHTLQLPAAALARLSVR